MTETIERVGICQSKSGSAAMFHRLKGIMTHVGCELRPTPARRQNPAERKRETTMTITKKVSVWYDDRSGVEPGWVARCTEYEDGQPVMGRIAMDEPIDYADTADEARQAAADYYSVDVATVIVER